MAVGDSAMGHAALQSGCATVFIMAIKALQSPAHRVARLIAARASSCVALPLLPWHAPSAPGCDRHHGGTPAAPLFDPKADPLFDANMDPLLGSARTHFPRRRAALACALRFNLLFPGSLTLSKNAHVTCFLLHAVVQGVAAPFCGPAFDSKLVPHLLQKWGHKLIPKWVRFAFVKWGHYPFPNWVRFAFEKWFHYLFKKWGRGAVGRNLAIA